MLYALCSIQEMAYHRDCDRSDANILHFYLKSLEFAALYTKLFQDLVNPSASTRKVFGGPYHSVVSHMATMYRYVSLKTVAVEAEESQFHDVR